MSQEQPNTPKAPTPEQIQATQTLKRYARWGGIFFFLFGLFVLVPLAFDLASTLGGAQDYTISDVAEVASDERTYARLTDGEWDCDTLAYIEGYSGSDLYMRRLYRGLDVRTTEVLRVDDDNDIAVWVSLSGRVTCDDLANIEAVGYLYATDGTPNGLNSDMRRVLRNSDTVLELCGWCGSENSMIGFGFGIVMVLLGLAGLWFGRSQAN
jgi:hypothetical protein